MLVVSHVVASLPGLGLCYCACLADCHGLLGHLNGTEPSLTLLVTPDRSNLLLWETSILEAVVIAIMSSLIDRSKGIIQLHPGFHLVKENRCFYR